MKPISNTLTLLAVTCLLTACGEGFQTSQLDLISSSSKKQAVKEVRISTCSTEDSTDCITDEPEEVIETVDVPEEIATQPVEDTDNTDSDDGTDSEELTPEELEAQQREEEEERARRRAYLAEKKLYAMYVIEGGGRSMGQNPSETSRANAQYHCQQKTNGAKKYICVFGDEIIEYRGRIADSIYDSCLKTTNCHQATMFEPGSFLREALETEESDTYKLDLMINKHNRWLSNQ